MCSATGTRKALIQFYRFLKPEGTLRPREIKRMMIAAGLLILSYIATSASTIAAIDAVATTTSALLLLLPLPIEHSAI